MIGATGRYGKWLGRVILIGVAVNVVNGLLLIFAPTRYFELIGFPLEPDPQIFVRFAGVSSIALGMTYVQAGLNPLRNPLLLASALFARKLAALFFAVVMIWLGTLAYWPILLVEAVFFLVPLWLVGRAFRQNLDTKP